MTDDEVLAQDKAAHPECSYATSLSTACRSVNGDRTCETIRKIFRVCPGKPKELIINSSSKEEGGALDSNADDAQLEDPFQAFSRHRRGPDAMPPGFPMGDDPFEAIDGFFRGMMGSPFGPFGQMPQPPAQEHETPPHHGYQQRAPRRQARPPKDAFEGYDGRVEEI
ncbi:hypothetical protein ACHHYP_02094 [Achlya hypogyna]|uniref:Uncharacterized protein n=1 Tax=Achlya hypogyna TaxID=1202772 RepID=A0A1V9Z7I5_ACHHY|nr:hypothetical protein ACHHYP_02094 [Achlya hypogyna]